MAAKRHKVGAGRKKTCKSALRGLIEYCTSGRRYETQNPYTVPEIKDAIVALGDKSIGPAFLHEGPTSHPPLSAEDRAFVADLTRRGK